MNATDLLSLHQKQTEVFIEASPSLIVLARKIRSDDGAGGVLADNPPSALAPQTVRLVEQGTSPVTVTPDGRQVTADVSLVGTVEFDVQEEDTFIHAGHEYEVMRVVNSVPWRKIAEAMRCGS